MSTRTTTLVSVLLMVVLASCGAPKPPAPPPIPPVETPAKSFDSDEIPPEIRVRDPKDARDLPGCGLLTSAQLLELNLLPDSASDGQIGISAGCSWKHAGDPDNQAAVRVITDTEEPALLGQYRLQMVRPRFSFEPAEVAGHPAVVQRKIADAPCSLETGIADDQLMSTTDSSTANQNSCGLARRMAEAVLSNLPPKR